MAKQFLGRGWKFPIQVDPATGRIKMSEYEEDIEESIRIILSTTKGERVMRPDFGSTVFEYIFNLTDEMTIGLLEKEIEETIRRWEPRVENVRAKVTMDKLSQEKLYVSVTYVVRSTNTEYNKVYPFYLQDR